jgi:predicted RNA-binding Zn-ribbon protein involved in translation (DUF1610 family)
MNEEKYLEVTEKDWFQTTVALLIYVATLVLFSVLLLPDYWYFWLLIVLAGLAVLVAWHAKNFAYMCPKCSEVFEASALEDFLGPNGLNKKYMKCPKCGKRAWAKIMRIKK